jgi:Integrase core domain
MAARMRVPHLSVDERRAKGKGAQDRTPPSSHAGWVPAPGRPDPVALLEKQNLTREPDLVPVRHGRMLVSPFTFTEARPRSWPPTSLAPPPPASTCSCAATPICPTSGCSPLGARHTFIRAGRPQTNGCVERVQQTILEECWKPAFARYLIPKQTGLRLDLERYLRYYNTERAHIVRWTKGRTPAEVLGKAKQWHHKR